MFNKLHVMVDIESLSTNSNARILSLAAVSVNNLSQNMYEKILVEENPHFDVDANTLIWWNKQDPAVKEEAFSGKTQLRDALDNFCRWFPADAVIWAKGIEFDVAVIKYALHYYGLNPPWHYRNVGDYRLLARMYPEFPIPGEWKGKHGALSDAMMQAAHLQEIMKNTPSFGW